MAMKTHKKHSQFVREANEKFPQIDILSEYRGSKFPMTFYCRKHDYTFEKSAFNFINSRRGCNLCAEEAKGKTIKKSPDWYRQELSKRNPNVELLSEYTLMQEPVHIRCKKCGYEYYTKAQDVLNGHSCKKCAMKEWAKSLMKSKETFLDDLRRYNPYYKKIEIIGEYTGRANPIKCRCTDCGYEWETRAGYLIDKRGGTGCPLCNQSKGEMVVYNYLVDNGIEFERQKQFDDLLGVNGFPLLYDYYIPSQNLLIEINGQQHYKPVPYFGGKKKFAIQKEHDTRKRKFAKENGIDLMEIKYFSHSDFKAIKESLSNRIQRRRN